MNKLRFLIIFIPTLSFAVGMTDVVSSVIGGRNVATINESQNLSFPTVNGVNGKLFTIESNFSCDNVRNFACGDKAKSRLIEPHTISGQKPIEADAYSGSNSRYINPNGNVYDQNAITNFNITNSNQSTMQLYSPLLNNSNSPVDLIKQNVAIPFKASNSTEVNVGVSKVEFNISY